MNKPLKPFACDIKNCSMTFANEDHLNFHKEKHTMGLVFDLSTKNNDTADQTPTPTSFFRNCEEVGLFQDLQNVNPFEETFKNALESSEIKMLRLHDTSNEDTLHTPHIFPVVEEPSNDRVLDLNNSNLSIVNLIEIPQIEEKILNDSPVETDLRNILKQAIRKKDKSGSYSNENNLGITKNTHVIKMKHSKTNIERVREINRASQMKCRMRKKKQMDEMLNELTRLRRENEELRKQNSFLRRNNDYLWKTIDNLDGSKRNISDKMIELLGKAEKAPTPVSLKKLPLLAPAGSRGLDKKPYTPIIFNLVPIQIVNTDDKKITTVDSSKKDSVVS